MSKEAPVLEQPELDSIAAVFRSYGDSNGNVNPRDLIDAMKSFGFEEANPVMFDLMLSFDKPEYNKGGLSFDTFVDAINTKLADRNSKESVERTFDIFVEGEKNPIVDAKVISKIAAKVGDDISDDEIRGLFAKGANNGQSVEFDEFFNIMTKKAIQ